MSRNRNRRAYVTEVPASAQSLDLERTPDPSVDRYHVLPNWVYATKLDWLARTEASLVVYANETMN